jgi:hypothetical protein
MDNNPSEVIKVSYEWECHFKKVVSLSQSYLKFYKNIYRPHPLERLNPRNAVRGSFSEVYTLNWIKNQNESMHFLDVNGLYSFCALNFSYMKGQYKILIGDDIKLISWVDNKVFWNDKEIFGVMLLQILPPVGLLKPFLPYRSKENKVYLTLCGSCVESQQKRCSHSENNRALIGSYFISEIIFALKLGYKILNIYEIYAYFEASNFLKPFVEILDFMKLTNSNLLRDRCKTELKDFCSDITKNCNFSDCILTPNSIKFNPRKRALYKLMANSFFGKFQQKSNQSKTMYVTDQMSLEKVYFENNITGIFCLSKDICQIQVQAEKNFKHPPSRIYNCLIGGQITAYARQVIYEHLITLEKNSCQVYYVDCDCLIFTHSETSATNPLPISNATGHFKYEIKGEIQNFFSFAIKNYSISYKESSTKNLKCMTKIKGLFLKNELFGDQVNNDLFLNFFTNIYSEQEKFLAQVRTQRKHTTIHKELQCFKYPTLLTQKRIVKNNNGIYETIPYGFCLSRNSM